ncbi:MAG: TIGR04190 family B12-binding domain/radical SAM domain protein, partial [Actinobacteria bacterium]|nr:TIGR04190 family B12-binding domain/radical SAM domain protein [Actinomycetota bacterium]
MALFSKPDIVLLHPPSTYDFRKMLSVPSPIADLIPSGPVFEMYPVGLSFLGEYLERHGIRVRILNLATMMLEDPALDVEKVISRLETRAFGISFHWLVHCHGALEIARICKNAHPSIPVVMGGYSASLFHPELLEYPQVDYVIRGDSAEEPLRLLLGALADDTDLAKIPNLTYRDQSTGAAEVNELSCVPESLDHLGDNYLFMLKSAVRHADIRGPRAFMNWWSYPLTAVLTCRGCLKNCSFCGGSSWSMARCFNRVKPAFRSPESIARDVETIKSFTGAPIFIIGDIRQAGEEHAIEILEALKRVKPKNHVVLELFEPAPKWFFDRLAESLPNYDIEISPESHDERVRLAAGKRYTNLELELNIRWALGSGCRKFDVFFMIGLPRQTPQSVRETIAYCSRLLADHGTGVNPLIGPLAPFLDPGSIAHEYSEKNGYRLIHQTLEDYRTAMLHPHWRDMLGYETECMSRQEIVDATYDALLELNRIKGEHHLISRDYMDEMDRYLRDCVSLLERLDEAEDI